VQSDTIWIKKIGYQMDGDDYTIDDWPLQPDRHMPPRKQTVEIVSSNSTSSLKRKLLMSFRKTSLGAVVS
jgi:hypothetical protein